MKQLRAQVVQRYAFHNLIGKSPGMQEIYAKIEKAALSRDSNSVKNIELRLLKWGRHLIFYNFDASAITNRILAIFKSFNTSNIHTD